MVGHTRNIPIVLLGALFAACADSDNDNALVFTASALNAPFILKTVNGAVLPAVVFESASPPIRAEALSGVITIMLGNVFTDVITFRQTLGGVVSTVAVTCSGTYAAVGNALQFVETGDPPDCDLTFTGVLSGTTLSASVLGAPAVFSQ